MQLLVYYLVERSKFDSSLKKYVADTEELKKNLAQTKISLNEGVRKVEMEELTLEIGSSFSFLCNHRVDFCD